MGGQDDVICKDDLASSIKTVDCKDKPDQQLGDSTKHQAHFDSLDGVSHFAIFDEIRGHSDARKR